MAQDPAVVATALTNDGFFNYATHNGAFVKYKSDALTNEFTARVALNNAQIGLLPRNGFTSFEVGDLPQQGMAAVDTWLKRSSETGLIRIKSNFPSETDYQEGIMTSLSATFKQDIGDKHDLVCRLFAEFNGPQGSQDKFPDIVLLLCNKEKLRQVLLTVVVEVKFAPSNAVEKDASGAIKLHWRYPKPEKKIKYIVSRSYAFNHYNCKDKIKPANDVQVYGEVCDQCKIARNEPLPVSDFVNEAVQQALGYRDLLTEWKDVLFNAPYLVVGVVGSKKFKAEYQSSSLVALAGSLPAAAASASAAVAASTAPEADKSATNNGKTETDESVAANNKSSSKNESAIAKKDQAAIAVSKTEETSTTAETGNQVAVTSEESATDESTTTDTGNGVEEESVEKMTDYSKDEEIAKGNPKSPSISAPGSKNLL